MPEYSFGVPCWSDLMAADTDAARAFYSELFGWEWEGGPMPEGGAYWMASLDGRRIAGLSAQPTELEASGWTTWINVSDADVVAARCQANGAVALAGPFDVPGQGRGAMVADPAGARFGLWQADGHPGADATDEPGATVWHEVLTPNVGAAAAFYGAVFGWTTGAMEFPHGGRYTTLFLGIETVGGAAPAPQATPAQWRVWFGSEDVAATLSLAEHLGGAVVEPVTGSPIGDFAHLADPAGALFSVVAA